LVNVGRNRNRQIGWPSQHARGEEGEDRERHDALDGEEAAALVARDMLALPGEKTPPLVGADAALVDFVKAPALVLGEVAPIPFVEAFSLVLGEVASIPFVKALALVLGEMASVPAIEGLALIEADGGIGGDGAADFMGSRGGTGLLFLLLGITIWESKVPGVVEQ
jgi:hypothetical protein